MILLANTLGKQRPGGIALIFKPFNKPGWDAGFHAFDVYKFKLEDTKQYKTTGPFFYDWLPACKWEGTNDTGKCIHKIHDQILILVLNTG
jgi:hypothetical protein